MEAVRNVGIVPHHYMVSEPRRPQLTHHRH